MVLLDFHLPDSRGYSGFLSLQFIDPAVPIVVVTAREDPSLVEAARALGAAGFVFKSLPLDDVAAWLRSIDSGGIRFPEGARPSDRIATARARIDGLSGAQHSVLMA